MQKQDFECSITAADRYRLGEPITVKFEIRNTSRETYRILTWGTPLGGDPLDFLTVTQDDVELEYDGPLVYHGDPAKDDWITLEPGASRSAEVDISRRLSVASARRDQGHVRGGGGCCAENDRRTSGTAC